MSITKDYRRSRNLDNAMTESYFSTLEFELQVNLNGLTCSQANLELADDMDHYNQKRLHSWVDYMSPVSYELEQMAA